MPRGTSTVHGMEIDEVSLVDRPANPHARITLAKRDDEGDTMPDADVLDDLVITDEDGNEVDYNDLPVGTEINLEDGSVATVVELDDDETGYGDEEIGKAAPTSAWRRAALRGVEATEDMGARGRGRRIRATGSGGPGMNSGGGARNARQSTARASRGSGNEGAALTGNRGNDRARAAGAFVGRAQRDRRVIAGTAAGVSGAAGVAGGLSAGRTQGRSERVHKSFGGASMLREALSKAVSDQDRDAILEEALGTIDELSGDVATAMTIAKSEQDARLESQYVEIAKNFHLPINADTFGGAIMRMELAAQHPDVDFDPEDVQEIAKALQASSDSLREIGMKGAGTPLGEDPMFAIEAGLDYEVSKSGRQMTEDERLAAVEGYFEANPGAYDSMLPRG